MARLKAKPDPAEQIRALEDERRALAAKKNDADVVLAKAKAQLADTGETSIRARRYQAELAQAEGRTAEISAVLAKDEALAAQTIRETGPRVEALQVAMSNIADRIREVKDSDEGIAWFTARAAEKSREAEEKQEVAERAVGELGAARMVARDAWSAVRASYIHRDREEEAPALVPHHETQKPLPSYIGHGAPWPGGKKPEDQEPEVLVLTRRAPAGHASEALLEA